MIIEAKSYASIADLKLLRLECKRCGAELILPLNVDFDRGIAKCLTCNQGWAIANNTSYGEEIRRFASATKELPPQLKSVGFNLSIEVNFLR
jgi:hypothetical protein